MNTKNHLHWQRNWKRLVFKCLQTFSIHITWQRAETVAAINDIARNMWFCWWEQFGLGMHGFFTHSLMKWLILLKTQNVSIFKTSKQMVLQFWAFLKIYTKNTKIIFIGNLILKVFSSYLWYAIFRTKLHRYLLYY